jgi:glycosyltransferase involved in cell wall biosynthesis
VNGRLAEDPVRVLHSYPNRIGADRICLTAWHQVSGVAAAGASVFAHPGQVARELPREVQVKPTLARGNLRVPYRVLGRRRAPVLHDHVVARRLPKLRGRIDIVHAWPGGALETLRVARALGIPTVLERPNAHTRFAYEVVRTESERIGMTLPPDHEHAHNADLLRREEEEFRAADRLLCPSDFVLRSFREEGFAEKNLARHTYGFDESAFYPDEGPRDSARPLTALFVGHNALRKGLHYGLEAWRRSPASSEGRFLVVGELPAGYAEKISSLLDQPTVEVLGPRHDVAELYRSSDIFVLPTLEEGSPLACLEALGSGCVPVVSDVCAGVCRHMENALVHTVGDVDALTEHLTKLHDDRGLLERLRAGALASASELTWKSAGSRLLDVYREVVGSHY